MAVIWLCEDNPEAVSTQPDHNTDAKRSDPPVISKQSAIAEPVNAGAFPPRITAKLYGSITVANAQFWCVDVYVTHEAGK